MLVLIIAVVLFLPPPYYQKTDLWCESYPPQLCQPKGWHLRPSIWREISGDLGQTVSHSLTPPLPPEAPNPSTDKTANWKTYTSSKGNYSLQHPPDWIKEENRTSSFCLTCPHLELRSPNQPTQILEVTVFPKQNTSLNEFLVKTIWGGSFPVNKQPQTKPYTLNNITGIRTSDIPSAVYDRDVILLKKSDALYMLDYSYLSKMQPNTNTFNQILSTFKFTE